MIIGIDASRANRDHKSGTEWYSYYLIRNIAKMDKENQYILYADSPLKGGLVDLTIEDDLVRDDGDKPEYDLDGYQIIKSPYNNFKADILKWPFSNFWTLGRLTLEMIIKRPNVLFIPAHGLPLITPKNTINTIHDVAFNVDDYVFEKEQIGSRFKLGKKLIDILVRILTLGKYGANSYDYLAWSTNFSLKKSKKIITISEFTKNEIKRIYNNSGDKLTIVYNGYNNNLYRRIDDPLKEEEILEKYGISKPFILNVGRLERKKNSPFLVESFARARHLNKNIKEKLVMIGDASFGYDEVKYAIEEFALEDDVIMPGWVEEEDMPYVFSAATAFVFPSLHEGFGIPAVQAIACGLPVICSDIPVLREILRDTALFFNPRDKDSIARAIEKIVTDENLQKELSDKGLLRARDFSWKKCAQDTLNIINSFQKHK